MKYTPRPWVNLGYDKRSGTFNIVNKEIHKIVCFTFVSAAEDASNEAKANSSLISAAPDLYEAAKDLVFNMHKPGFQIKDTMERLTKAVMKAEGESEL